MSKLYDVAVVGAGPAGAVFAARLAALSPGLSVLLIDGQTETRKKPCGGLLAPDAQKALAGLGLTLPKSILADPQIFTVKTMDIAAECTRYYQRHYLNMDRYRFDRWLLSLVPQSVEVIADRVFDIIKDTDFTLKTAGGSDISARFVVGADGGGSVVRRKLYGRMPKQYISIQEWYENKGEKIPFYSCVFDKATSDSCSWTVYKDGYVVFGGAFDIKGCREAFTEQKKRVESFIGASFGESVKREACLVTSPRTFSDFVCGGDGYYLLGEAAGFISSSSFEGISSALLSACSLAEAFCEGKNSSDILKFYKKKTLPLRLKLTLKTAKRAVLCNSFMRRLIMRSGICSV